MLNHLLHASEDNRRWNELKTFVMTSVVCRYMHLIVSFFSFLTFFASFLIALIARCFLGTKLRNGVQKKLSAEKKLNEACWIYCVSYNRPTILMVTADAVTYTAVLDLSLLQLLIENDAKDSFVCLAVRRLPHRLLPSNLLLEPLAQHFRQLYPFLILFVVSFSPRFRAAFFFLSSEFFDARNCYQIATLSRRSVLFSFHNFSQSVPRFTLSGCPFRSPYHWFGWERCRQSEWRCAQLPKYSCKSTFFCRTEYF